MAAFSHAVAHVTRLDRWRSSFGRQPLRIRLRHCVSNERMPPMDRRAWAFENAKPDLMNPSDGCDRSDEALTSAGCEIESRRDRGIQVSAFPALTVHFNDLVRPFAICRKNVRNKGESGHAAELHPTMNLHKTRGVHACWMSLERPGAAVGRVAAPDSRAAETASRSKRGPTRRSDRRRISRQDGIKNRAVSHGRSLAAGSPSRYP